MTGTAIVVGGGIGGLAAAIGLRRAGWTATVLERARTLGEVGAGMSQSPNALRCLDALGVGDRARAIGVPVQATNRVRTPSGRFLVDAGDAATPLRGFHRADLHRLLLDAVPVGWIRTGTTVTGLAQVGDQVTVHCGAERLTADLVVAADGVRSTVRGLLWPDVARPHFEGYTVWRAIAQLDGVEGSMTVAPGSYVLVTPLTRGRVYWALGAFAARPGIHHHDELGEVRRRIGGWHAPIPALLDATPPAAVLHHDLLQLPPLDTFVHGRVALVGDAAHAMYPDLGQGAGQALEDAVVLAAELVGTTDVPAALAAYDRQRRPRAQAVAKAANAKGLAAITSGPLRTRAQNLALRLLPSSVFPRVAARALGSVWDWTPPPLPR